ncbi:MAG: ATP-binding protein [Deltaproteobacteria bacterium]|nr:ATP-binding protein [Nannocystaceae bacterium]
MAGDAAVPIADTACDAVDAQTQQRQLSEALRELQMAQAELTQAHKLSAIGQLAAGVAHEINTPIQYVGDNVAFLERVFAHLLPVLEAATQLVGGDATAMERLRERLGKVKLARVAVQVPRALEQSLEGIARVSKIVGAMKAFSHPSGGEKVEVDLRHAVESTVTIAGNEWKYVADIELDIPADLPPLCCLGDELNQVILNLVVNAAHAIGDVVGDASGGRGIIRIAARFDEQWCEIRVGDTGGGIPEAVRSKIFDPFFTTKGVGKGTGQGLAIAYNVVVEKHGGTIAFETELGCGTTFIVRIPRVPPAQAAA